MLPFKRFHAAWLALRACPPKPRFASRRVVIVGDRILDIFKRGSIFTHRGLGAHFVCRRVVVVGHALLVIRLSLVIVLPVGFLNRRIVMPGDGLPTPGRRRQRRWQRSTTVPTGSPAAMVLAAAPAAIPPAAAPMPTPIGCAPGAPVMGSKFALGVFFSCSMKPPVGSDD